MNGHLVSFAMSMVRAWTRVYTWRMPAALCQQRRAEIESDLWEFQRDVAGGPALGAAAQIVLRLLMGMPDDFAWRVEHAAVETPPARRTISFGASAVGAVLFVCAIWTINVDASRPRTSVAFSAPTVDLDQGTLTPLASGIVAVVGASMMPRPAAQSSSLADADRPAFAAASIKPNKSGSSLLSMVPQPGGRFTATNVTLGMLIRNAYQVPAFRIVGGPDWIEFDRFDVAAKAEDNPSQDQIHLMLQTLLTERFNLRVHHETREQPLFQLVLARRDGRFGPRLRRSSADCASISAPGPPIPNESPLCGYLGPTPGTRLLTGRASMAFRGLTMEAFARFMGAAVRRSVTDRTNLSGYFDGDFDPSAELGPPPPPPGIPDPFDRQNFPSIFTVLQEQLGLKLESKRGPVDVLVIDSAEPPTSD